MMSAINIRISTIVFLAGVTVLWSAGLHACALPGDIVVPDGATASTEDIRIARATVQLFMSDMDAYLECLNQEDQVKSQGVNYSPEDNAAHTGLYNSGVDIMEAVASQFNQQLSIFKAKKDAAAVTETTP